MLFLVKGGLCFLHAKKYSDVGPPEGLSALVEKSLPSGRPAGFMGTFSESQLRSAMIGDRC